VRILPLALGGAVPSTSGDAVRTRDLECPVKRDAAAQAKGRLELAASGARRPARHRVRPRADPFKPIARPVHLNPTTTAAMLKRRARRDAATTRRKEQPKCVNYYEGPC
jgi:hypothetical protein